MHRFYSMVGLFPAPLGRRAVLGSAHELREIAR
jgi:hypothetical protein